MSNASEEPQDPSETQVGISDDQLPEDLVPGEDNPLAEGVGAEEQVGDLLEDGRPAQRTEADGPGGLGSTDDAPAEPDSEPDSDAG